MNLPGKFDVEGKGLKDSSRMVEMLGVGDGGGSPEGPNKGLDLFSCS